MTPILKILREWPAKLAFWRKRPADAAPESEAVSEPEAESPRAEAIDVVEPASDQPAGKPGWLARLKGVLTFRRRKLEAVTAAGDEVEINADPVADGKRRAKLSDEPEVPEPKPGFLARLKQWLTFRRKKISSGIETDVESIPEPDTRNVTSEQEAFIPEPKLGFLSRLKRMLSFRRKPAEMETEAVDKTQRIEKTETRSDTTGENQEEAPPPSRLKRLLLRLRRKWVWIPALSLTVVGIASWLGIIMMNTVHEKERLQAELKAAKKMLAKKAVTAVVAPAPPPVPTPAKPEKKTDPAFEIVGHIPVPQSEDNLEIGASDCIVKDKQSVSENLKHCITSFNEAIASVPATAKKP